MIVKFFVYNGKSFLTQVRQIKADLAKKNLFIVSSEVEVLNVYNVCCSVKY